MGNEQNFKIVMMMMVMIIVVIYSGNDDCNKTMKMVVSDGV